MYNIVYGQSIPMPGQYVIGPKLVELLLSEENMVMFDYSPELSLSFLNNNWPTLTAGNNLSDKFEEKYPASVLHDLPKELRYIFDKDLKLMAITRDSKPLGLDEVMKIASRRFVVKDLLACGNKGVIRVFKYLVMTACRPEATAKPYLAYTAARIGLYTGTEEPIYSNYIACKHIFNTFTYNMYGNYDEYSEVKFWALLFAYQPELAEAFTNITLIPEFLRILEL